MTTDTLMNTSLICLVLLLAVDYLNRSGFMRELASLVRTSVNKVKGWYNGSGCEVLDSYEHITSLHKDY